MSAIAASVPSVADIPVACRVVARHVETSDVVTLRVHPLSRGVPTFEPAQFSMIGVVGVGEVPISISSDVDDHTAHGYTIRRAGAVTSALVDQPIGGIVTTRGPFGRPWNLERVLDRHAVFVAGGIGLAPLRAAIDVVVNDRAARRVSVLVGSATPVDRVFRPWLRELAVRGVEVVSAVDRCDRADGWRGHVGLVTDLIPHSLYDADVAAFVCGPDAMMSAAIRTLRETGVAVGDIEVTLERNMQCGTGWCGHCQLGPFVLCRDGPVLDADRLGDLLDRSEL